MYPEFWDFPGGRVVSEEHTEFKWVSKNDWNEIKYTPEVKAIIKYILAIDRGIGYDKINYN